MQTIVKVPMSLFRQALADLNRPHPFAFERAGFFSTRCSRSKSTLLVHCVGYTPVADDHYIHDESVGVRIGPLAVAEAMTRSLVASVGQIHVHAHGGAGLPQPSSTDSRELPSLLRSLHNANPSATHGWMILGTSDAWASVTLDGVLMRDSPPQVSLVGFPLVSNHRSSATIAARGESFLSKIFRGKKPKGRYDRQSFLGPNSEAIIAAAVVGVVGLGGGGSHIVQQLAHLGFRNFVLCDPDRVSETNLNRMVGATHADFRNRRLKVDVADRCIRSLHKDANIVKCPGRWEDSVERMVGCDLAFGCVDSFLARRDLESFCRRHLIPLIDVGMDVIEQGGRFEIIGQVLLSMPGKPCMRCMNFLNDQVLATEAQLYGAAGGKPQVVWSNGLLCSAAVGIAVDLLTDWSRRMRDSVYLRFRGGHLDLREDNRMPALKECGCLHYPLIESGDAVINPL